MDAIGDALAPATIAHAVLAGRRHAEELDGSSDTGDAVPFKREFTELLAWIDGPRTARGSRAPR